MIKNIFNSRHNMIGLYFEADAYRHKYHLTMYLIPTLYVSFSTDEKANFLGFKSYRIYIYWLHFTVGVSLIIRRKELRYDRKEQEEWIKEKTR